MHKETRMIVHLKMQIIKLPVYIDRLRTQLIIKVPLCRRGRTKINGMTVYGISYKTSNRREWYLKSK